MKKIVTFSRHHTKLGDDYYNIHCNDSFLEDLAFFLWTEVECFGSSGLANLINLLKEGDESSGNMINFERKGNNLYLSNLYYNGPEETYKKLKIPITTLITLMQIWEKLMKEKPEEIILSYKNGHFDLTSNSLSNSV